MSRDSQWGPVPGDSGTIRAAFVPAQCLMHNANFPEFCPTVSDQWGWKPVRTELVSSLKGTPVTSPCLVEGLPTRQSSVFFSPFPLASACLPGPDKSQLSSKHPQVPRCKAKAFRLAGLRGTGTGCAVRPPGSHQRPLLGPHQTQGRQARCVT